MDEVILDLGSEVTLLHFDPKYDGASISFFKLTKNHKDNFFFGKCGNKRRLSDV